MICGPATMTQASGRTDKRVLSSSVLPALPGGRSASLMRGASLPARLRPSSTQVTSTEQPASGVQIDQFGREAGGWAHDRVAAQNGSVRDSPDEGLLRNVARSVPRPCRLCVWLATSHLGEAALLIGRYER